MSSLEKHLEETGAGPRTERARARAHGWREALAKLSRRSEGFDRLQDALRERVVPELRYHLNIRESRLRDRLVIDLVAETEGGGLASVELEDGDPSGLLPSDRDIVGLLFGAHGEARARGLHAPGLGLGRCSVRPTMYALLLPKLAGTGRFYADLALPGTAPTGPLRFAEAPFEVRLVVERLRSGPWPRYRMWGALAHEGLRLDLDAPRLLLSDGLALVDDRLVVVRADERLDWALRLRRFGAVEFPEAAKDAFLTELARMPDLPELELPPELHWSQVKVAPRPKVVFAVDSTAPEVMEAAPVPPHVSARVLFEYGGVSVPVNGRDTAVVDESGRRLFRRDLAFEREQLAKLRTLALGIEAGSGGELRLPRRGLSETIKDLIDAGWSVEADGAAVRSGGALRAKVRSGIDWFDLDAAVEYAPGAKVELPELLRALLAGRVLVRLSDGSRGLVPPWAKRYAALARIGRMTQGKLRFLPSQAGVIDVLLAGTEAADVDVKFEKLREQLRSAADPADVREPPGFKGHLRDYQRAGVAWMRFLEAHGYGGCLADDMGLGKTVQVLCVLQARHRPRGGTASSRSPDDSRPPPSLVVVPKSLVHNWVSEAKKFTELSVLDYTGANRTEHAERLGTFDVVVTTYGTLRQEILRFTELRFTTLVLDEAQAIKNPRSQAAKACRLIQAEHRLAISGTPIENGLEELWSLFEFLNPGMLGGLGDFASAGRERDEAWLESLSRALKPFMLRRTKSQVLHELPEKTEQVWEIPLGEEERRRYEELRRYYWSALQGVLDAPGGLARARIHVLEALLRLRQAACHPGLVDPSKIDAPSAKIDALFDKLRQIVPRGHKVLVFSQFTTLLEVVRRRLERESMGYAYLDGSTADRQRTVASFTDDPACSVFLISLKAGGCGLNLTESDYVFLLDPWWNPAIEAQAVDRAHRMGQKKTVFAYKMIAQDTVEEKILALQGDKRRLADAIVVADEGPLASLDAADLAALLGREDQPQNRLTPPG